MKQFLRAAMLLSFSVGAVGVFAASGSPAPVPATEGCTLRIHATGFRNQKGLAGAAIFASPRGWPEQDDDAAAHGEFPISGSQATLTFTLPPGTYGVVVLHDENENHKLDRNFLGLPTEGFGFANNPPVFLIAPPFAKAAVGVTCPVTEINIKMIYK